MKAFFEKWAVTGFLALSAVNALLYTVLYAERDGEAIFDFVAPIAEIIFRPLPTPVAILLGWGLWRIGLPDFYGIIFVSWFLTVPLYYFVAIGLRRLLQRMNPWLVAIGFLVISEVSHRAVDRFIVRSFLHG